MESLRKRNIMDCHDSASGISQGRSGFLFEVAKLIPLFQAVLHFELTLKCKTQIL